MHRSTTVWNHYNSTHGIQFETNTQNCTTFSYCRNLRNVYNWYMCHQRCDQQAHHLQTVYPHCNLCLHKCYGTYDLILSISKWWWNLHLRTKKSYCTIVSHMELLLKLTTNTTFPIAIIKKWIVFPIMHIIKENTHLQPQHRTYAQFIHHCNSSFITCVFKSGFNQSNLDPTCLHSSWPLSALAS